jgi:uncharacterized membrane protein YdbT with pleckstrin-like domain
MGYIDDNLLSGEQITYRTRLHWIVYLSLRGIFTLFLAPFIQRKTTELAVTSRRVVVKTGFIQRHTLELNLIKVESVSVEQTLMGRMLGYGTISVIGTGGTKESFNTIADPLRFRKAVQEAIDQHAPQYARTDQLTDRGTLR